MNTTIKNAAKDAKVTHLRQNARKKYDTILQSAHRLFIKHGYTHTSVDAIAADAGVSKQTVYSYFKNKDVLFCRMIEVECTRYDPSEEFLTNPKLSPEEVLFRIGQGFMDMLISHRGLAMYRLVIAEAESHPRIARLFYESAPVQRYGMLVGYLERQKELGVMEIDDCFKAAVYFFGMVRGPYHLQALLKLKPAATKKQVNETIRETVELFLKLYRKKA